MTTKLLTFACCLAAAGATVSGGPPPQRPSPGTALTAPAAEADRWADSTLKTLSLEQKVGQMICEQMRGEYTAEGSPQLEYLLRLVREFGVGGFVLYGGTPHDTARLLNRLQRESRLPLLISADFEGGPGQQIAGAAEFPANMALAAIGSEDLAYAEGRIGALEGRAIGIHLTYSPVVDIQTRVDNPVLGVRSFGSDLDALGRLASAYIRGYQENGMLATAKHYPGRGEVNLIPGTEFTINPKPADRMEREDLRAFKHAIDAGVAFVMSEHIAVPSLTNGSDLPASVEPQLASEWLRGRLGFNGILTSDDLWYTKMTNRFGAERTGVMAIQAGHDVLLKPADAIKTVGAVVAAVKNGEIPLSRIDESVRRVLSWKARLNLHRNRFVDEGKITASVGTPEHLALVRSIADRSLTLLVNDDVFPTTKDKTGKVLHLVIQKRDQDPAAATVATMLRQGLDVAHTFVVSPSTDARIRYEALRGVAEVDTVMISVFNPRTVYQDNGPLRDQDLSLIRDIIRVRPHRTIVMSYGNPYLADSVRQASAVLVGYGEGGFSGNQVIYADSVISLLKGEIGTSGHLPVTISERFRIGAGIVVAPARTPSDVHEVRQ